MRAKQRLFLFTLLLAVCGVIFWRYNAPIEHIANGSFQVVGKVYIPKKVGSGGQDFEKEIREDINLCNDMYTEYNATSHHYELLQKKLFTMQNYTPAIYSGDFQNPCWYGFHLQLHRLQKYASQCTYPLRHMKSKKKVKEVQSFIEKHLFCLPAFFLPAFPKCATTTLFKLIVQHPQVAQTACKEHHFWNHFIKGYPLRKQHPLWYLTRYTQSAQSIESNPMSITLDASPVYVHSSGENFCVLPVLLKRVLPEATFVLVMRNPSARYFSHYWFAIRRILPFKIKNRTKLRQYVHTTEAMEVFHNRTVDVITQFQSCSEHGNSVLYCMIHEARRRLVNELLYWSMYYYHIKPWLNIMPRERFLFLRTEDLANDPSLVMSKVWNFLHLEDFPAERVSENVNEVIKDLAIPQETRKILDEFYQPYNQLLAHFLSDDRYLWKN